VHIKIYKTFVEKLDLLHINEGVEENGASGAVLETSHKFCFFNVCVFFINIHHAPLHSNTKCFRVKYSQYGYMYLQLTFSFF